jgi:PhoD-like phosphatase
VTSLSARSVLLLAMVIVAVPIAARSQTLEGFASFPADTFAPGPTSGQFITAANGRTPPFVNMQPVQGISSVLRASDLKLDFKDPNAPTIATEFVTPAITTGGDGTPYGPYYAPMIPFNPHIKYYEGDRRGYFKATVTPERMRLDLRFVTSVQNQSGTGYAAGSWEVEDGTPGAFIA